MPTSILDLYQRLDAMGLTVAKFLEVGAAKGVWRAGRSWYSVRFEAIEDIRLRTSLYFDLLQETNKFLTDLAAAVDPQHQRIADALTAAQLLARYCLILDEYLVPGLNADLGAWEAPTNEKPNHRDEYTSIPDYFERWVLNERYEENRETFRERYPTTQHAMVRLTFNFHRNIGVACERILRDWDAISTAFEVPLQKLECIEPMGSDSHKAGQQVLKLTFSCPAAGPRYKSLIYKPSDVEVDCRIIGKAAAVNRVHPDFMTHSLLEIINNLINAHRPANLHPLPTYQILPMHYGTSNPEHLWDSYGYLEFLLHQDSLPGAVGLFSWGRGDFRFYSEGPEQLEITNTFYRMAGALLAIACTFSFQDLHVGNVIVSSFCPFLIDLEICLTSQNRSVRDTDLMDDEGILRNTGGLTGCREAHGVWNKQGGQGRIFYEWQPYYAVAQNHLSAAMRIPPEAGPLNDGLNAMLDLLGDNINSFNDWFEVLMRGAVVRYLPASTNYFRSMILEIYFRNPRRKPMAITHEAAAGGYADRARLYEAEQLPNFEALNPKYTERWLFECDMWDPLESTCRHASLSIL